MLEQCVSLFKSFFIYPGITWNYLLVGIGLGLAFGAIWLCAHWPPLFKIHRLWVVMVGSAFLTLLALAFVQVPLQNWVGQGMLKIWNGQTIYSWLLLAGIPGVLLSGLVQEGAKMVPAVIWWWRSGRNIDPKLGLAIGAIAGAGYGIFEAAATHNQMFAGGWTLQAFQTDGFLAVAGFWEMFFVVGFHIAASALAGYGLAKGKGWQFYLIAAGLHALLNYCTIILVKGYFSIVQLETYVAVVAVAVATWALLLRWGRNRELEAVEIPGTVEPTETGTKADI